jgi:membrane protease YdiL (CAAX protease family)
MFDNLAEKNYLQLMLFGLVLLFSSLILMGLGYFIGIAVWNEPDVTSALSGSIDNQIQLQILKMMQILNQLSMFIIPPLTLYIILRKRIPNYLNLNKAPNLNNIVGIVLLYISSLPIIQASMIINQQMVLPEFMSGIEEWMRDKEDLAAVLTEKFLTVDTFSGFLLNILMMAILPAIGEELLFRGLLMRWFEKSIKNIHFVIIITAFLFSAIHIQFFGFIPRFILGIILGYTYHWSKSLWVPICLHFINNATTVTVYYYVNQYNSNINPEEVGTVDNYGYLLFSIIIFAAIIRWLYQNRVKN